MKLHLSTLLLFIPFFLLVSCARAATPADNGFDQICKIYTNVLTDPANKSRTRAQKVAIIYKSVYKTVTSKPALNAFDAYMAADPKTRYDTLKKVAQYELKHPWSCPSIKSFK